MSPSSPSLLRRSFASVLAVLTAVAAISCSDGLFGGGRHYARVVLAPQFTPHDAEIYSSLRSFGLGVTSLHIVLVRPATTDTLADTTVTIADGQDSVLVAINVAISGSEEKLIASMEMTSGGILVFSGSVEVLAKVGADVTGTPPTLVPVWVGPGKEATAIRIAPRDTTISATAHLAMTAVATDANENPVVDPEFSAHWQWRVIETSLGSIPLGGGDFIGSGTRGVARVRVFTPNLLEDTVSLTLVPPATHLAVISGDAQSANAGAALAQPFVVEVRAADNLPVPNTVVRFSVVSGGGSVLPDSTLSNASGRVQTNLTLGESAGANVYQATVAGLPPVTVTGTGTITRVATSLLVVSGGGQTAFVTENLAQPFVVEVRAQDDLPMAGVTVNFAATAGGGGIAPTSAVTDAAGRAQTTMTLGAAAGTNTYQASASGLTPVSVNGTATVKAAASIKYGNYSVTMNVGANGSTAAVVRASDNTVLDTASVTYTSRTPGVATVGANGVVTGVAKGQAIILAEVTSNPALRDSLLAIVTANGGVMLVSSIDRFDFPKDTTFTVTIYVDMRSSGKNLGSTTIDVAWNPAQLIYQSHANGSSGVVPTVNASNVGSGDLKLAMADVAGFSGKIEMLRITFKAGSSASTGSLALTTTDITAADLTSLLSGLVQITNPLSVH